MTKGEKKKIDPLTMAPAAFAPLAEKVNEIIGSLDDAVSFRANLPLRLTVADYGPPILEVDIQDLSKKLKLNPKGGGAGGASGGGSAGGLAFNAIGADGKLGAVVRHSSYSTPTTYPTELKVVNGSTSVLVGTTGVIITNASSKTCTIAFSEMTQNVSLREINICDGGTSKKMLVLGSAPYT